MFGDTLEVACMRYLLKHGPITFKGTLTIYPYKLRPFYILYILYFPSILSSFASPFFSNFETGDFKNAFQIGIGISTKIIVVLYNFTWIENDT